MSLTPARILIVMGVASSGKSVTGKAIARRLHAPFLDGDAYHPSANKDKMRAGIPLTLTVEQIADRAVKAVPHLKAFKRKQ